MVEHKVVEVGIKAREAKNQRRLQAAIDAATADGWELVAVSVVVVASHFLFFKREVAAR